MDLRDDDKSLKTRKNQYAFNRYYESNAGHLFVSHINPFDTVGDQGRDVKESLIKERNTQELIAIFENRSENSDLNNILDVKKIKTTPSTEIVDEIMKTNPFTKNIFMSDRYCETDSLFIEHQRPNTHTQPTTSISATVLDDEYGVCSRNMFQSPGSDHEDRYEEFNLNNNRCTCASNRMDTQVLGEEKKQCEKMTYCRPLLNMYNQEFIYKTMQRNVRLQKLVKKLAVARQREKEREAWNNYINDLKNKHRYYSHEPSRISPQYVPGDRHTPEMIDDFYNTRFHWRQSNPCQHLLDDFYKSRNYAPPRMWGTHPGEYHNGMLPEVESFMYDNNHFCYPTCSQANMRKWNRERLQNNYGYDCYSRPSGRYFRGNTIVIEKEDAGMFDRLEGTTRPHAAQRSRNRKSKRKRSLTPDQKQTGPLPLVDETEINNVTATTSPAAINEKNIYYPYAKASINTGATGDQKDLFSPSVKEESEISRDSKIKQKPLKNNIDPNVPYKETAIKNQQIEVSNLSQPHLIYVNNDSNVKDEFSDKRETFINNVVQTKIHDEKVETEGDKHENLKDTFKKVTENISKLRNKLRQSEQDIKIKSLSTIELKVDGLMKSINSIMEDIKKKKSLLKRNASVTTSFVTTTSFAHQKLHRQKSDPYGIVKNEKFLCSVMHNSSRSLAISDLDANDYRRQRENNIAKIDKILIEEMNKSNKVKRDIEELLNMRLERSCSVQITFDIPTKERSTEITDSLSKAKIRSRTKFLVEEIQTQCGSDCRQMTIAVNTDPLGLLDLLKISTDTIKRLFSYVPYLSYNSYFSLLQLPTKRCASHYICNICGAVFGRPSQLSDHIEQHTLGRTRDCCVCRHALDMPRAQLGLFACRYCGQRFTRAYCRELHEQTCARHLGRIHDVNSGHVLLR